MVLFRGEFFLTDYIYKIGNFDTSMIGSAFRPEGYFDWFNGDKTELSGQGGAKVVAKRKFGVHEHGNIRRFEFIFSPNIPPCILHLLSNSGGTNAPATPVLTRQL